MKPKSIIPPLFAIMLFGCNGPNQTNSDTASDSTTKDENATKDSSKPFQLDSLYEQRHSAFDSIKDNQILKYSVIKHEFSDFTDFKRLDYRVIIDKGQEIDSQSISILLKYLFKSALIEDKLAQQPAVDVSVFVYRTKTESKPGDMWVGMAEERDQSNIPEHYKVHLPPRW